MFEHEPSHRSDVGQQPVGTIRCACCCVSLADPQDALPAPGGDLFINPAGVAYEVLRVTVAHNVEVISEPSLEATWFAGYAWVVLVCAGCHSHVGWQYRASSGQTPTAFVGFVRAAVMVD